MVNFVRSIAERLLRNKSFIRHLPTEFDKARLWVTPDSQLKYLKPGTAGLDLNLLRSAAELIQPGMTIWDVGANVGVFTFAAAVRSGKSRRTR